jgi:hypothetical protein
MKIRALDLEKEYDAFAAWWTKRELTPPSKIILQGATGFAVKAGEVDVTAGWLYVANKGVIGIVEWMVVNPSVVDLVAISASVNLLYDFLEKFAREAGCSVLFTSTQLDGSIRRFLQKRDWTLCEGKPHVHLLKVLQKE